MNKYDGCSGGMSIAWRKWFGQPPPWEGCCDVHDQPYAKGGSWLERLRADVDLLVCVWVGGHPLWAIAMFIGVRIGGVPWLPTPWRWGFNTPRLAYTDHVMPISVTVLIVWGIIYAFF